MAYAQNHTYQDILLVLGETWTIRGTLNKDNQPFPIDDSTKVLFKLANQKTLILSLSLTQDIVITDQSSSAYQIVVQPSQQMNTPALIPGLYRYELSIKTGDGGISIQAEGGATINASLSYRFPSN